MPPRPRRRRPRGYIERLPSGNYRAVVYAGVDLIDRQAAVPPRDAQDRGRRTVRDDPDAAPGRRGQAAEVVHYPFDGPWSSGSTWLEAGKLDAELLERYYARLQRFRRLAQRLKLRSTRLHSLRQYSATELIAAGVDVAQLERQNRKEHAERRHDQKVTEVRQRNVESSALLSRDHL